MDRPLIGLSGRRKSGRQIAGTARSFATVFFDVHVRDYSRCVADSGGLPVQLPMDVDPEGVVARLDGLVLTGGADIAPTRYGHLPDPDLGPIEPERDEFELALFRAAHDRQIPILGICRGHQLINVALGGTLHQHLATHPSSDDATDERIHGVRFASGSCLAALYGADVTVNSIHHQAIDQVGQGLTVTAWADDGVVEGAEHENGQILSVQWHPELLDSVEPVFGWLVERAGQVSGSTSVTR